MSVLVKLQSNVDSLDSYERGHSTEELTAGLPDAALKAQDREASPASGAPVDAANLREALSYLDPDVPYDKWRDIVAGIGAANCHEARDIAHEWSEGKLDRLGRYDAPPSKYNGPDPVDAVLDTMPPTQGGIGVGSVEHAAHAAGWDGTLAPRPSGKDRFAGALAHEMASATKETETGAKDGKLLPSYMGEEISNIVPPRWLARDAIPIPAVGIWFGKRAVYKTGSAAGAVTAVLTGTKMFSQFDCEQGDAVLVAGEGLPGLRRRVEAHAASLGRPMSQFPLLVIGQVPRIGNDEEWDALIATIEARGLKNVKLIVIDHLSIMLGGADQNDATVGTVAMQRLQSLAARFNCTVIVIAHAGKEDDREVRGSSAFLDNVDFAYELKRVEDSDIVKVRCAKMRDGEAPEPFHLKADITHGAPVMIFTNKDAAKRAAGQNVGLRVTEVSATLQLMGACPGGANEWTGRAGGIPTRPLAAEIARLRHEVAGDRLEASAKEIDVLVMALNRDGKPGGKFDALVVRQGPGGRQWAIAPGPICGEHDHA